MNTLIYNISENFNFNNLKVENPSLVNANNYFSKIYNNNSNKNFYIQLPKCKTKHGIVNSNSKCFCELEFNSNEKLVVEFFENLENFCLKEICANKALWFYDSDNISSDDIQEYMTPIMRSYKGGKKFLIKTNIKQDKLIVYDENEKKINLTDYDDANEFIPLLNINGIKFSKSSFIIEIILVQFMVLYPSDSFENQILIKFNKQEINPIKQNSIQDNKIESNEENRINNKEDGLEVCEKLLINDSSINVEDSNQNEEDSSINVEDSNQNEEDSNQNVEDSNQNEEDSSINIEDSNINTEDSSKIPNISEKNENIQFNNTNTEKSSFKYLSNSLETIECNNDGSIELINLDTIDENTEPIELKTHETIYLEIYKKAKQKAKEIRKNAIEAFLEAKNIKNKYNLNTIMEDSSSDEENELLNLN